MNEASPGAWSYQALVAFLARIPARNSVSAPRDREVEDQIRVADLDAGKKEFIARSFDGGRVRASR